MNVKDGEDRLFTAVEQGAGKNVFKVFVLMKPTKRVLAQDWISKNISKIVKWVY